MSEEEDDDLYFDLEDKSVPDVDPMRIAKMEITAKGLDENPQTLVELAGDIPNLKILAEHIGVLMSAPGIVAYSADARQQLEFSFRVFCSTLLKDQAKKQATAQPSAPVENTDKINLLTKKLFEAEKNLALLKNQYAKVERDNNNLRIENENLQKEVEQHFEERQNLLNKITLMRRQEDANLSSLKQEVDDTNNEMQNVRGKLLQTEFSVKRLQEQLDAANEENTQLSTENIDLKSKLESKSDKVDSLKSDLSNMKVSCESLEAEKNVLLTENSNMKRDIEALNEKIGQLEKGEVETLIKENENNTKAAQQLTELCQNQAEDILRLRNINKLAQTVICKQLKVAEEYEKTAEKALEERDKSVQGQKKAEKELNDLKEKLDAARNEIQELNSGAGKYGSVTTETKKILEKHFSEVRPSDIPKLVDDLIKGNSNTELLQQNERLLSIIENQLRFLSAITMNGDLQTLLLKPDAKDVPLQEDKEFKDNILVMIARIRQYISQNGLRNEMDPTDVGAVAESLDSTNIQTREAYDAIAAQSINTEIIRKLSEKTMAKNQAIINELVSAAGIVNYEGLPEDSAPVISQKLREFQAFARKAQEATEGEFNPENYSETLSFLTKFIQQSANVVKQVNEELRTTLDFDGDIEDIPYLVKSKLDEVTTTLSVMQDQSFEETKAQLEDLKQEHEKEMQISKLTIEDLEGRLNENVTAKETLQLELDKHNAQIGEYEARVMELLKKKSEAEGKLARISANYGEVEADLEKARQENERIRKESEQKKKQFDEKLENMLKQEREQHSNDLLRFESRLKQREQKLNAELDSRQTKINKLKSKIREIQQQYDTVFKQQKEATAILRSQNEELVKKVSSKPAVSPASIAELEKLRNDLKTANAEKQILQARLEQAQEAKDASVAARDAFWKSKYTIREEELSKSLIAEADDEREKFADFVDQVISELGALVPKNFNKDSTDEVLKLIKKLAESIKESTSGKQRSEKGTEMRKVAQTMMALQEWDRWARELYVNVKEGELPTQSSKELRFVLGEMVLSSINHRKLSSRLDSLRAQKKLLQEGIPEKSEESSLSFKSLLFVSSSLMRIMKRSGHMPSSSFKPISPLSTPRKTKSLLI